MQTRPQPLFPGLQANSLLTENFFRQSCHAMHETVALAMLCAWVPTGLLEAPIVAVAPGPDGMVDIRCTRALGLGADHRLYAVDAMPLTGRFCPTVPSLIGIGPDPTANGPGLRPAQRLNCPAVPGDLIVGRCLPAPSAGLDRAYRAPVARMAATEETVRWCEDIVRQLDRTDDVLREILAEAAQRDESRMRLHDTHADLHAVFAAIRRLHLRLGDDLEPLDAWTGRTPRAVVARLQAWLRAVERTLLQLRLRLGASDSDHARRFGEIDRKTGPDRQTLVDAAARVYRDDDMHGALEEIADAMRSAVALLTSISPYGDGLSLDDEVHHEPTGARLRRLAVGHVQRVDAHRAFCFRDIDLPSGAGQLQVLVIDRDGRGFPHGNLGTAEYVRSRRPDDVGRRGPLVHEFSLPHVINFGFPLGTVSGVSARDLVVRLPRHIFERTEECRLYADVRPRGTP